MARCCTCRLRAARVTVAMHDQSTSASLLCSHCSCNPLTVICILRCFITVDRSLQVAAGCSSHALPNRPAGCGTRMQQLQVSAGRIGILG